LNKTVYSGEALSRLHVKAAEFPQHQYYTLAIRGAVEIADRIREYNVLRVNVVNNLIIASGNCQDWEFIVMMMKRSGDQGDIAIADNIRAALPDVFNSGSSALVKA
jgi:hypothetical protein